ncbi:DNA glycosylase [Phlegmacium glaucopus]|nr:DNA glycosylase [Phlegmacium glaucopus]
MAEPDPNIDPSRPNPFTRFVFQPAEPSSLSVLYLRSEDQHRPLASTPQKSLGKRKNTNPEDPKDVNPNPIGPIPFKKKKPLDSPSGSKNVKIYKHLRELDDHLQCGLDIVFCGINPGQKSSQIGHHYGNPTNHFWSCLHLSGLTSSLLPPTKDYTLPQDFSIGLTDLVSRPTIKQSELAKAEQVAAVSELMKKITLHQPRIICFVGLGIADIVKSVLTGKIPKSKTMIGLQPYRVVYPDGKPCETLFYAVSSTSGRVVQYQKSDKVRQFTDFRVLVEKMKDGGLDTAGLTVINVPV